MFVFVQFLWNSVSPRHRPCDAQSVLSSVNHPHLHLICTLAPAAPICQSPLPFYINSSLHANVVPFPLSSHLLHSRSLSSYVCSLVVYSHLFKVFISSWYFSQSFIWVGTLGGGGLLDHITTCCSNLPNEPYLSFCNCQWWTFTLTHKQRPIMKAIGVFFLFNHYYIIIFNSVWICWHLLVKHVFFFLLQNGGLHLMTLAAMLFFKCAI